MDEETMTDRETLDKAKALFTGATQDGLAGFDSLPSRRRST